MKWMLGAIIALHIITLILLYACGVEVYALGFHSDGAGSLAYPWGILTYPWVHLNTFAMLLNVLMLYGLWRLYGGGITMRGFVSSFVSGSLAGAVCLALVSGIDSYLYSGHLSAFPLFGASAGVCALAFRLAMSEPRLSVRLGGFRLNFLLLVLLIYVAHFLLIGDNLGGMFAHLGGALWGLYLGLRPRANKPQDDPRAKGSLHDKLRESGYKSLGRDEIKSL